MYEVSAVYPAADSSELHGDLPASDLPSGPSAAPDLLPSSDPREDVVEMFHPPLQMEEFLSFTTKIVAPPKLNEVFVSLSRLTKTTLKNLT